MFMKLEIKNFESHVHSVFEFDKGFTLICGVSDAGKSSVLRAVRLVTYNEWDPDSLRIGCKFCEIKLTTDRGIVKVRRGKNINEWEVTPNGEPMKPFSKPGSEVIPDVADVIGIKAIGIGNYSIKPNLMNQLENHFLMAGMDGKDVSSSARAQVIDEISGLSGMEELIREVSLENTRNAREITKLEETIKELEEKKHDGTALQNEEALLASIEKMVENAAANTKKAANARDLLTKHVEAKDQLENDLDAMDEIPDVDAIAENLDKAQKCVLRSSSARGVLRDHERAKSVLEATTEALGTIPDTDKAEKLLDGAEKAFGVSSKARKLLRSHTTASTTLESNQNKMNSIPDTVRIGKLLDNSEKEFKSSSVARKLLNKHTSAQSVLKSSRDKLGTIPDTNAVENALRGAETAYKRSVAMRVIITENNKVIGSKLRLSGQLKKKDTEIVEGKTKLAEAMSKVDVCPLTLNPISGECLEIANV